MTAAAPGRSGSTIEMLRGAVFVFTMYLLLAVMGLVCLIPAKLSRRWAMVFIHAYCRWTLWLLRVVAGTRVEFRGEVPSGPCIIAAKHQSFLDIIALTSVLPRPAYVMKKSLRWAPVIGIYAERLGSIAIDRNAGSKAVQAILEGAARQAAGRQIIIFPQGTRVPPGREVPYRAGMLRLYEQLGEPIEMVALNTGWFWPRTGIRRTPGTAVVEFLGSIDAGRRTSGLLDEIAETIEAASGRLADEAAAEISRRQV